MAKIKMRPNATVEVVKMSERPGALAARPTSLALPAEQAAGLIARTEEEQGTTT